MHRLNHDWKKLAASMDDGDSMQALEKAFADQAYAQLQLRLKPLLRPPYRIGFEIVYSNAPENTRLVGVFAFRVNNEILLVPSCFVEGSIKGQELIYREKRKKFVPLSEEWAEYLVARGSSDVGAGVPRGVALQHPSRADLWRLASPPAYSKQASADELPRIKQAAAEMMEAIHAISAGRLKLANILEDFVDSAADCGVDAFAGLDAIARASEKSAAFDDCVYGTSMDERLKAACARLFARPKQAAAVVVPELTLRRNVPLSQVPAEKRAAYLRDGYFIEDRRAGYEKSAALNIPGTLTGEDAEYRITDANLPPITSVSKPGPYEILLADGSSVTAMMFFKEGRLSAYGDSACANMLSSSERSRDLHHEFIGVTKDKKLVRTSDFSPQGYEYVDGEKAAPEGVKVGDVKACVPYLIVINGVAVDRPHEFRELTAKNGVRIGETARCYKSDGEDKYRVWNTVMLNPDAETRLADGVLGGDALFYEASCDEVVALHEKDLFRALMSNRVNIKGAAYSDAHEVLLRFPNLAGTGHNTLRFGSKAAAASYLCVAHGVHGGAAQAIVAKASKTGFEFCVPADELTDKVAAALPIHPTSDPYWTQGFDSAVNVTTEGPQTFAIPTFQQKVETPQPRIGDGWDPDRARDALLSGTPQQLADFSRENDIPNLMDHGSVGELIKVYDVGALMDRILPKLEDALDGIGRLYFLIQWKPEDFKVMYGDNDLPRKESEALSNFKSVGDMVLDLSKRSREVENASSREKAVING